MKTKTNNMSEFKCQYCGRDTGDVDFDYLINYDHLSCALEAEGKAKMNEVEVCVLCGKDTPYVKSTHIDFRNHYIEGAGQLCQSCYNRGTSREHLAIPTYLITDTPNDQELGAKIRKFYYDNRD
jgi:hypothetical protein